MFRGICKLCATMTHTLADVSRQRLTDPRLLILKRPTTDFLGTCHLPAHSADMTINWMNVSGRSGFHTDISMGISVQGPIRTMKLLGQSDLPNDALMQAFCSPQSWLFLDNCSVILISRGQTCGQCGTRTHDHSVAANALTTRPPSPVNFAHFLTRPGCRTSSYTPTCWSIYLMADVTDFCVPVYSR